MEAFLLTHEGTVRLAVFGGLLLVFVAAEAVWPRRARTQPRTLRWITNIIVSVLNTLALRVAVPVLAVGAAAWAQAAGIGLFNFTAVSGVAAFVITLLVMDAAIYAQHLVFHHVPVLWRIHRVHHADRDIDATTALRFHPVEIVLSMGIKIGIVIALGAPPAAVIAFETILNGMAMFNHANLRLPTKLDALLRIFVVTPDMHRVHHSVHVFETNSNFGFNLSWWDRLFGTYRRAPRDGQETMTIGLSEFQDDRPSTLGFTLWLPFVRGH